jgi:hypothetical protein
LKLADIVHSSRPQTRIHYTDQDILTHYSFESDSGKLVTSGWQSEVALADDMAEFLDRFHSCSSINPWESQEIDGLVAELALIG